MTEPSLRRASEFAERDIGRLIWDPTHNPDLLSFSDDRRTVEWGPRRPTFKGPYPPAWVPIRSRAHLHSATFKWDFVVEEMADAQIGVGFMLQWDQGLDWGFFGYLGAGVTAWAYDPSTGDVVSKTESIAGDLPTFENRHSGVVSVRLALPRARAGTGTFVVNGSEAPTIQLPVGAVVVPAACLCREEQRIRLAGFARTS
jgi:hypothetical protein